MGRAREKAYSSCALGLNKREREKTKGRNEHREKEEGKFGDRETAKGQFLL